MALFEIPTSLEVANYIQELDLDGTEFRLSFLFNTRDSAWYLDIFDPDDVPLRMGIKIVNEFPLLRRWRNEGRPAGEILAIPNGDQTAPAGIDQLGQDIILTYADAEEVADSA